MPLMMERSGALEEGAGAGRFVAGGVGWGGEG